MRIILLSLVTTVFIFGGFFITTDTSLAALVPCDGPNCQTCDLVKLGNNIIKWLVEVMAVICALVIAVAGFKMVISAGNSGAITQAKEMITNTIIGFVILLAAWLIVDTVMKMFVNQAVLVGPWYQIQCVAQPTAAVTTAATSSASGVYAAGTCRAATGGVCSPDLLQGTFGSAASQASQICMAESGGNAASLSSVDRLRSGGEPFSVGLYQINLTVHELTGCGPGGTTLNCKSAFQGRNFDARIVNRDLYNQCVTAAQDSTCNIRNAYKIYRSSNDTWRQWSTARICGL